MLVCWNVLLTKVFCCFFFAFLLFNLLVFLNRTNFAFDADLHPWNMFSTTLIPSGGMETFHFYQIGESHDLNWRHLFSFEVIWRDLILTALTASYACFISMKLGVEMMTYTFLFCAFSILKCVSSAYYRSDYRLIYTIGQLIRATIRRPPVSGPSPCSGLVEI